jgi:hypothetical protein
MPETWKIRTHLSGKGDSHPMAASGDVHAPDTRREPEARAYRKQGITAGLFGAVMLAAWFLYLDMVRGRPLFTPTLLAHALIGADARSLAALRGSIPMTLLFTAVHGLVFVLIGLGAAEFLRRFVRVRSRALIVLLLFGVLCIAFFGAAASAAAVGPESVAVRDAVIGNALAAFAMAAYLARNLPRSSPG